MVSRLGRPVRFLESAGPPNQSQPNPPLRPNRPSPGLFFGGIRSRSLLASAALPLEAERAQLYSSADFCLAMPGDGAQPSCGHPSARFCFFPRFLLVRGANSRNQRFGGFSGGWFCCFPFWFRGLGTRTFRYPFGLSVPPPFFLVGGFLGGHSFSVWHPSPWLGEIPLLVGSGPSGQIVEIPFGFVGCRFFVYFGG